MGNTRGDAHCTLASGSAVRLHENGGAAQVCDVWWSAKASIEWHSARLTREEQVVALRWLELRQVSEFRPAQGRQLHSLVAPYDKI
eukprot:7072677-Prymnesium_polylepis.1